jgi:amino acid adenylation domain-containing protein
MTNQLERPQQQLSKTALALAAFKTGYFSNQCIHQLFQKQATKTPEKIALAMEKREFTYRQVNSRANQIANALRAQGVNLETPVGVCLRRSPEAVIAILGILKAGGAYVPVDPDFPEARKQFIIEDSGLSVLITEKALLNTHVPSFAGYTLLLDDASLLQQDSSNLDVPITPESLMYILYTSGSTGTPKGVCGIHRATVNRFVWMWNQYPFNSDEVCCHRTTLNFVDSVWEMFGGLLQGIKTVILPYEASANPHEIICILQETFVTRLTLVPSLLQSLLLFRPDLGNALPAMKIWTVSGEQLTPNLLQKFRESVSCGILLNLYGSTEVAGDVTCAEFSGELGNLDGGVPIGQPILNAESYILDENLQPVPSGKVGELWVGGLVLARGYHNKPEETKARFIPNPFSDNGLLFKTGDLAIQNDNGVLYYMGRIDNQVKLRGFRVELEEIESVLGQFDKSVSNITVVVCENESLPETKQLVAFVVPSTVNVDEMKKYALSKLPNYMVPAQFVVMDELPLTVNGKVDRQALSRMSSWSFRVIEPHFLPQSQTEKLLADIWQQMFRVSPVSRQDNFFQLGGDSLSVVAFLEKLKEEFGVLLPIPNFVNDPSLASLARLFDEYKGAKLCSVDEVRLMDVEIVPFEDKYLEKTVKLVSESFTTREPEVVALGITKQEFDVYAAICCRRRLKNLSYVAVQKPSGRVVGYCLSEDFANYLLAEVEKQDNGDSELPESMTPIFALWHSLEEMYKSSYGEVKPGDILYVQLSGAASDVDSTAIALALEKKVLEVAASFNYKRVATTCTQIFTRYIALEEMGYQRKYAIDYDVFEFEGERIFSSIAKTHKEAVLVEKCL